MRKGLAVRNTGEASATRLDIDVPAYASGRSMSAGAPSTWNRVRPRSEVEPAVEIDRTGFAW